MVQLPCLPGCAPPTYVTTPATQRPPVARPEHRTDIALCQLLHEGSVMKSYDQGMSDWTLLTNHAHVLICIAREPGYRLREIADCVGLTERATHRLVDDLVKADYLTRHRH